MGGKCAILKQDKSIPRKTGFARLEWGISTRARQEYPPRKTGSARLEWGISTRARQEYPPEGE